MSHAPKPWYVEVESGGVIAIKDAQGCDICRVWDDGPEWLDNAERLVQWANAFDDLLAASQKILAWFEEITARGRGFTPNAEFAKLRAAIAKATKEHP